jgi:hypothetical protein
LFREVGMKKNGYYLPGSCRAGNEYFLRTKSNSEIPEFRRVIFLGYRPHPAEVIIREGNKSRMVYRSDLFTRLGDEESPGRQIG